MSVVFEEIKSIIQTNDVVLFMKGDDKFPMCGFSGFVVQVLQSLEINFKAINILENAEMRQGIKDFTNWPTIPQLYIKGDFIGGADIIKEMHSLGELKSLLCNKGILSD